MQNKLKKLGVKRLGELAALRSKCDQKSACLKASIDCAAGAAKLWNAARRTPTRNWRMKGFIRTTEATIAVIITLIFAIMISNQNIPTNPVDETEPHLSFLSDSSSFRNCVIANNTICVNESIRNQTRNKFEHTFLISKDANTIPSLPDKEVRAESYYFSANETEHGGKIVRVYYWRR